MNNEEIKDLMKLVSKLGLGKVEIESEGFKVSIKGANIATPMYVPAPVQMNNPAPPIIQNLPSSNDLTAVVSESKNETSSNLITIKSTMIGTFYRSTGPDKDPFVNVGSIIQKGDKLCIIEAMKLFNEIESEVSGKIVKTLVDDASPVEFDQPLFLVEPA